MVFGSRVGRLVESFRTLNSLLVWINANGLADNERWSYMFVTVRFVRFCYIMTASDIMYIHVPCYWKRRSTVYWPFSGTKPLLFALWQSKLRVENSEFIDDLLAEHWVISSCRELFGTQKTPVSRRSPTFFDASNPLGVLLVVISPWTAWPGWNYHFDR